MKCPHCSSDKSVQVGTYRQCYVCGGYFLPIEYSKNLVDIERGLLNILALDPRDNIVVIDVNLHIGVGKFPTIEAICLKREHGETSHIRRKYQIQGYNEKQRAFDVVMLDEEKILL